jgi:hypothetical protein
MVPVDYFLFPGVKRELGVISVMQESFKESWDGVARTIAKDDFTAGFGDRRRDVKSVIESAVAV